MTGKDKLWVVGIQALVAAVLATLAVRWVALATLEIPPEFPPLAAPFPTIFFTSVSAVFAVGVFALVQRRSKRPGYVFRWIASAVLLLSFLPDAWLLSDGGAAAFPGATPVGVSVLMLMHVVAAAVIVGFLTRKPRT